MTDHDLSLMQRALTLAERGRGAVEPNPLVGAVLVRGIHVVGEGWHQRYGGPHAEIHALEAAGSAARGSTLYVTLEPCCHHGKTPPCTEALIRAGVARVIVAMSDPFPQVSGQGLEHLRAAGIEVTTGLCEAEAQRLNAPYLTLLRKGRPYVHLKWAMSLDGKIATRTGHSQWISNEASRKRVHHLRGRMDAIVVGIGTALADDPLLTARPPGPRTPLRIVLDSHGRLPLTSNLARTAREYPTLIVVGERLPAGIESAFCDLGCDVLRLPTHDGRPQVSALLEELGKRRMTNVLVEGGAGVFGSFVDSQIVDEAHVFIAPIIVGGTDAKTPIGGQGVALLTEALRCEKGEVGGHGNGDVYWHGHFGGLEE